MSKLIETLQTLDKKEVKTFASYLHSPFFCQHEETIRLFDFLASRHPDFGELTEADLNCWEEQEKLPKQRMNVLRSYLFKHLLNFLAQMEMEANPTQKQFLMVESLWQRNLYKEAGKQLKQARLELEEAPIGANKLLAQLQAEQLQLDLDLSEDMRNDAAPLARIFGALQQLNTGLNLKYLLPAWTLHRLYGSEFPEEKWQRLAARTSIGLKSAPPLTQLYFHLMHLLREEDVSHHYELLTSKLKGLAPQLEKVELMNIYGYLQNHLTHQLSRGAPFAYRALFDVYQKLEEYKLIFGRGEFSRHLIRNITITGCRLGELDWTRKFLLDYHREIHAELGNNAFPYSFAYLEFCQGKHKKALQYLQEVVFDDPFYRTGHQTLLIRIFYELGDFESLHGISATFRRYLNRKQLFSQQQKALYLNFLSVIHQLANAREKGVTKKRIAKIRDMLNSFDRITDKDWLLKKLEEIQEN